MNNDKLQREVILMGLAREARGAQFPGRRITMGAPRILSSMQYICFRKTLGSNMGPNLFLTPGAI